MHCSIEWSRPTGILFTLVLSNFLFLLTITLSPSWRTSRSKKLLSIPATHQVLNFPYETVDMQTLVTEDLDAVQSIAAFQKLVIDNYVSWHSHTRASYEAALSKKKLTKPPRLFIVRSDLSSTHGLGDRFRGIVTAYFLAVISRRLLLIDWRIPIPLSKAFISPSKANFTYDEILAPPYPFNDSVTVEGNYYHRTDDLHTNVTTLFLDSVPRPNVTRWFNPPDPRRKKNWLLRRLAQYKALDSCTVIPLIFRALFRPTPALRDTLAYRISQNQIRALRIANNIPFVAIHARLGYGLGELWTDSGRFNLERLGTSLIGMARCFVDAVVTHVNWSTSLGEPRIFLATDTPEFRPLVAAEVASRIPNARLVFIDADVKHVRDLSANARKDIAVFMDTFVDIFLLSKASSLINLRSGFSELATWMGAICHQTLITYEHCAEKFGTVTSSDGNHSLSTS